MTSAQRRLDDAGLFDWLRLSRSDNVGPRTFHRLIERFGTAGAAIAALPGLMQRSGSKPARLAPVADIDRESEALRRAGLVALPSCDPAYPAPLRAIDSAPPVLIVKGRLDILKRPMVAIVGSRNASAVGLIMTERLARALGEAGYAVVSGLARGIDAKAHLASVATGTIGVLAGGHDRIYPSEHAGLAERMAAQGAVISEMPFAWEPRGRDFPRRNRLVSGLSLGVVVVEAAHRSGSLITARFASEQGRVVFAVPGSPLDPRSEGTNALLRNGAILCATPDHLLDDLAPMRASPQLSFSLRETGSADEEPLWDESDAMDETVPTGPLRPVVSRRAAMAGTDEEDAPDQDARQRVLDLIGASGVAVDEIVRLSGLPAGAVQSILLDLDLEGRLIRAGAGTVSSRPV